MRIDKSTDLPWDVLQSLSDNHQVRLRLQKILRDCPGHRTFLWGLIRRLEQAEKRPHTTVAQLVEDGWRLG
jgi:hypothetical protein